MDLRLRHARRPMITAAAIAASAALIACGGSDDSGGEAEASFEDAQIEFAECMRENGVDFPDPEPGEGGGIRISPEDGIDPESESFQAAQEECQPIIEDAVPEGERPDPAEIRDQLHEMTECLRDRGYDVPEPNIVIAGEGDGEDGPSTAGPGEGGGPSEELERLRDDPEFQQAQEECSEEADLPGGPGSGRELQIGPGPDGGS